MDMTPPPIAAWLATLPSQNVGTLYAKIRPPFSPIGFWYKVEGWGQLCDGRDHRDMVHLMLHNYFPFYGKGWTYIAWRCEPDNPDQNKHPRTGDVEKPVSYSGVAYDDGTRRAHR